MTKRCLLHIFRANPSPYDSRRGEAHKHFGRHIWGGKRMKLKTGVVACGAALGLTSVVALGTGTAFAAPYVHHPILLVSNPNPSPGENDGVRGFGYVPNETVSIDGHSVPVHFANVPDGARGSFTLQITIPEDWCGQRHTITGTGTTGDSASAELFVQGCGGGGGGGGGGGDHHHRHHRFHHEHGGFGGGYCDDSGPADDPASDDDAYSDDATDSCYEPGDPGYDDDGPLPSTGAKVAGIGGAGAALIAGGVLLTVRRRRRTVSD